VKGKLANGMGSQYSSHFIGTWCIQHHYRWWRTPRLPVVVWTDSPAVLNGLLRFAERRNLFSARVPSYFKRGVLLLLLLQIKCTDLCGLVLSVCFFYWLPFWLGICYRTALSTDDFVHKGNVKFNVSGFVHYRNFKLKTEYNNYR